MMTRIILPWNGPVKSIWSLTQSREAHSPWLEWGDRRGCFAAADKDETAALTVRYMCKFGATRHTSSQVPSSSSYLDATRESPAAQWIVLGVEWLPLNLRSHSPETSTAHSVWHCTLRETYHKQTAIHVQHTTKLYTGQGLSWSRLGCVKR